jgi:fatty acid desaturase
MTFVTALATSFGITFRLTGVWAGGYFLLLWVVPLIYVFPYLMLLREIYQHANADEGDLTNSRMMFTDPFTRWAVLGYGNGAHLVHHIYPNIPQYHLSEVHIRLLENSEAYETAAEETYGILRPWSENQPSLLDALSDQETQRAQDSA